MAEKDNTQICARDKAVQKAAVNPEKTKTILARRSAVICRGYNRAWKHRISEAAS